MGLWSGFTEQRLDDPAVPARVFFDAIIVVIASILAIASIMLIGVDRRHPITHSERDEVLIGQAPHRTVERALADTEAIIAAPIGHITRSKPAAFAATPVSNSHRAKRAHTSGRCEAQTPRCAANAHRNHSIRLPPPQSNRTIMSSRTSNDQATS